MKKTLIFILAIVVAITYSCNFTEEIHLNETGFSCFCLLINQAEFARFQEMNLEMIGPMLGEKKVNEKVSQFRFGFIRDPNHYLVEYYLS